MNMFTITIPGSSANIGPGFDSAGLAINRYLTLQVTKQEQWEIIHDSPLLPDFADYKEHYIYQVASKIAMQHNVELPSCHLLITSEIPLARGLGSSASAVVAGIELANQLCGLHLTKKEKLKLATSIEGHPDNVTPAIFGGYMITATLANNEIEHIQLPNLELDIVIYIPDTELKTSDARKVLPTSYEKDQATSASGVANVMIASLLTKDYALAGKMMENDQFHEPYRASLIPHYENIKQHAKQHGAFGTVISGAGPTMISFYPKGEGPKIAGEMKKLLPTYDVLALEIDYSGVQVK